MLKANAIRYAVGQKELLKETCLLFESGRFHVIMGSNGAGKSTLLKMLAGELRPSSGNIEWNTSSFSQYSKKELARKRAVLSQHYHISFPINVFDVVLMGRYPFFTHRPGPHDLQICRQAMELMNVATLEDRDYQTLSGGEAQKVQMSRVLAQIWTGEDQEEKLLLLDEPVSHLDIKYQYQLLQAAKNLCNHHVTVIAILHDINLAISFADHMIFLKEGEMVFETSKLKEVTPALVKQVFDISSTILYPENHKPVVIF